MNPDLLLDPLFRLPFAVGLVLAAVLPLLGTLLRLRDEWLAALGLAHLAGATGLLGLAVGIPAVLGAAAGAVAGALAKGLGRFNGNTVYASMILVGWATTLLVAANTALGSVMGHALVEGQLYFAGRLQLAAALLLALLSAVLLPAIVRTVVRARLFPGLEPADRQPARRWHLGFDLLVGLGIATGTGTLGLMAAFALVFVPPIVAFRIARSWRTCQWLSPAVGVVAFVVAFVVALVFDQPFGPVLVAVLLVAAGLAGFGHALAHRRAGARNAALPADLSQPDSGGTQ